MRRDRPAARVPPSYARPRSGARMTGSRATGSRRRGAAWLAGLLALAVGVIPAGALPAGSKTKGQPSNPKLSLKAPKRATAGARFTVRVKGPKGATVRFTLTA